MPARKATTTTEDIIELDSSVDRAEFEPRAPLFKIDGELFTARTKFSASEYLKYIKIARTEGADAAVDWAMEAALGEAGYLAFLEYPYLTTEQARKIINQVTSRLIGPIADPK